MNAKMAEGTLIKDHMLKMMGYFSDAEIDGETQVDMILGSRWVHTYYVKNQDVKMMPCPTEISWVIKKVLAMRKFLPMLNDWSGVAVVQKFSIRKTYKILIANYDEVQWKNLICSNKSPPKTMFITWLTLWGKIITKELMNNWIMNIDLKCVLCNSDDKSINHLFFCCRISEEVWSRY